MRDDVCSVCGGGVCRNGVCMGPGSSLPGTMTVDSGSSSSLSSFWGQDLHFHLLDYHDGQVICGVARDVEMGCYWFLEFLGADVTAVSVEADVERVLRLSHVLRLALPALDVVDNEDRKSKQCLINGALSLNSSAFFLPVATCILTSILSLSLFRILVLCETLVWLVSCIKLQPLFLAVLEPECVLLSMLHIACVTAIS